MTNPPVYLSIYRGMRYWFARIILGTGYFEAKSLARGQSVAAIRQDGRIEKLRCYWRKKQQGLTWCEIKATRYTSPEQVRQENARYLRQYRARWGGDVSPGSIPWIHREQAKLATKLEME